MGAEGNQLVSASGPDVKRWQKDIDTCVNPHRSAVGAEKGACTRVLVEQTPHGEGDRFDLVAARQLPGGFFDQRHDF